MSTHAYAEGHALPVWQVMADNDAVDSGNAIHEDSVAQRYGFKGGLVPGVTTYGYMTHPLVAAFGADFLARGRSTVRLRRPIYEGEQVAVHTRIQSVAGDVLTFELEARNPAGEICAVGTAQYPSPRGALSPAPPRAPLPNPRRPATPEALAAEPVLGTLEVVYDETEARAFLARLGETLTCYPAVAHPGWLLRQANYLVDRSIALGPWVHTESEVEHLGVVRAGETFSVTGRVVELTTHKGNDYADIDVLIAGNEPVMRVRHRAIYRLGA